MRTALDAPDEALDAAERKFVAEVKAHGWFRTAVFSDAEGPGFSYSTGFQLGTGHPELVLFGLKSEIAHDVFWDVFRDAEVGKRLVIGTLTNELFGNLPACVFPVAKRFYADYLGWSRWFYGGDAFDCLQIVWPDRSGVFPWEKDFDPAFANDQLDLTENGWKAALGQSDA